MWTWCRATILMALAVPPAAARNNVVAHILPAAETRPWPPRASEAMTPPVPLPGPTEALSTVVAAFVQRAPRAARTKQAATRQAAAKQAATTKAEWKPVGCVDDALFIDATGYACSAWTQFSCVSQPGYTAVQLRDVQRNCPQACGQCRGGAVAHRRLGACLKSEAFPSLGGPDCPFECPAGHSSFSYKLFGMSYGLKVKLQSASDRLLRWGAINPSYRWHMSFLYF